MADRVKLSKDGNSIDFVQSESIPTSVKKFRQSPEIEGFYRFIFENDLQKETYEILERIVNARKAKKKSDKVEATAAAQSAKKAEKAEAQAKKVAPTLKKVEATSAKKATPAPAKKAAPAAKAPAKKAATKPAAKKAAKKK